LDKGGELTSKTDPLPPKPELKTKKKKEKRKKKEKKSKTLVTSKCMVHAIQNVHQIFSAF